MYTVFIMFPPPAETGPDPVYAFGDTCTTPRENKPNVNY